jgi:uncharacterized protein
MDLRTGSGRPRDTRRMKRPGRFLTAEWNNLLLFNFAVDPALLLAHVPPGTELDTWAGRTFLSLVGFEFNRTRVLGVAVPFHRSFEEVNLRFYVRRGERRGVAFLCELVPRFAVAAVARGAFGENYRAVPMTHRASARESGIEAEYTWGPAQSRCSMRMRASGASFVPDEGSLEQFITEHYWGYTSRPGSASLEYEVQHPQWPVRKCVQAEFTGDATQYYGPEFARVLARAPDSACFAEGSAVAVFKGTRLHGNWDALN